MSSSAGFGHYLGGATAQAVCEASACSRPAFQLFQPSGSIDFAYVSSVSQRRNKPDPLTPDSIVMIEKKTWFYNGGANRFGAKVVGSRPRMQSYGDGPATMHAG